MCSATASSSSPSLRRGQPRGEFRQGPRGAALQSGAPHAGSLPRFLRLHVYYICSVAAENGLVAQFHTGLGRLEATSASSCAPDRGAARAEIRPLPRRLSVDGRPAGAFAQLPQCLRDLCWLPLISTSAAKRFLREALEVGGAHRCCGAATRGRPRRATARCWLSAAWFRKRLRRCTSRATSARRKPAISPGASGAATPPSSTASAIDRWRANTSPRREPPAGDVRALTKPTTAKIALIYKKSEAIFASYVSCTCILRSLTSK